MKSSNGMKSYPLSKDHRPTEEKEYQRILKAGGKIYQTEANYFKGENTSENIIGPLRVMPGKLSVSRAFGDIEAKSPLFNGNPNVVIAKPDIKYFDINSNYDFIVIGCDGIFENMKNKELIEIIWKNSDKQTTDIHNKCGILVESVVKECIKKKFTDNLTVVLISFKPFLEQSKNDCSNENDKYAAFSQQVHKQPNKFLEMNEKNLKMQFCMNSEDSKASAVIGIMHTPQAFASLKINNYYSGANTSKESNYSSYINSTSEDNRNRNDNIGAQNNINNQDLLDNIFRNANEGKNNNALINKEKFIALNNHQNYTDNNADGLAKTYVNNNPNSNITNDIMAVSGSGNSILKYVNYHSSNNSLNSNGNKNARINQMLYNPNNNKNNIHTNQNYFKSPSSNDQQPPKNDIVYKDCGSTFNDSFNNTIPTGNE